MVSLPCSAVSAPALLITTARVQTTRFSMLTINAAVSRF
jgi:hypothetical protein